MHAVRAELLRRAGRGDRAAALRRPIPCAVHQRGVRGAHARARSRRAVAARRTHVAFGDLFLADVARYREACCGHRPEAALPAVGSATRARSRARCWRPGCAQVSRASTRSAWTAASPGGTSTRRCSATPAHVDPCGERGEFHTFAYAGPMFASRSRRGRRGRRARRIRVR